MPSEVAGTDENGPQLLQPIVEQANDPEQIAIVREEHEMDEESFESVTHRRRHYTESARIPNEPYIGEPLQR